MSEENVEIARQAIDAWNRRDIDDLIALSDPEGEYVNNPTALEPGTRRGRDEVTAVIRTQWDLLTDGRWEIDRLYNRGEEIIALGRVSRRMPGSDARLEDRSLISYRIRSGKIVRTEVLGFGRDEVQTALEAAGLSEENVETLNRIAAAWNRRDLEAWLGFMHPEIDWQGGFTRLEGAIYRGRDGMRGYWSQTNAALELVVSFDEVRDLGDTVLGLGHLRGRSQGGIPIDTQYGIVMSFRDGLAVSGSDWDSHAEALEAAGLSE